MKKIRAETADAYAEIDSLHATEENEYTLLLDGTNTEISDGNRRRMLGSDVRRYGFIDRVSDVMAVNEDFILSFPNEDQIKDNRNLLS